ncbi:MAG TPA: nucleoside recognition protein [Candidatus Anaerobutyricum avicola]|nr:nucleoside recognition protein [Candidatus Anaerobutyricum avicola]
MLNILWVIMMAGGILFASFHGTMGKVTEALIDSSTEAVNLCIFMLGVIGVWNGMMEIAVKSGLMKRIAQVMYPFIHWLFPDIPRGHKANEYIAANMAANILGLGWAATPAGLKAMQELRSLDEGKQKRWTDRKDRRTFLRDSGGKAPAGSGRASDMMCAFLVLNISSLQLIPINMIAYRSQYGSVEPAAIVLPSIVSTAISTLAGILFIKAMEQVRKRRRRR